jgi:2-polyprenyl-6-hydroxyphenyl methylase/3-demethylubiquinone-9 3-methyltransferase
MNFWSALMNAETEECAADGGPLDAVAYHRQLASGWDARYRKKSFKARQAVLIECLNACDISGGTWLDAGCGTGTLSRRLAERGCKVLGVDAAIEMIEAAVQLAQSGDTSAQLTFEQVETIARLPLVSSSCDGILCSSVLEYVSDVEACLKEFARVLRPGGLLLVSVPNRHSIVRLTQVGLHHLGKRLGQSWFAFLDYSHNQYSAIQFGRQLAACGFRSEKVVAFGSPLPKRVQRSRCAGSLLLFVARRI